MAQNKNEALLQGLLEAMRAEHEGEHFYRMAARSTENPKGREVLSQLALEEREHASFLKAQYESILETGEVDGKTKGFSYALSWTMPLSGQLLFQTKFKINDYKQDIDFEGQRFKNIDETYTSLHVGLAYVF
jgi:rubrerythrin